jgi:UDP-N-acetylmuramyl tripeptide synthase
VIRLQGLYTMLMNVRKIVKSCVPTNLFMYIEPYGHLVEAMMFNVLNGFPGRGFKIIGVTGTNGKTTTVFMVQRMLYEAGFNVGMISTVAYGVGSDIKPQMTHMTTPTAPVLMKRLKAMRAEGVEWLVLETTSQALAQNRVWGIPYSIVVFTNLTHEHLSYHKTFERYRNAKVKLFKIANRNKQGLRTGIVNADDPNAHYFADAIQKSISFCVDSGDIRARLCLLQKGLVLKRKLIKKSTILQLRFRVLLTYTMRLPRQWLARWLA